MNCKELQQGLFDFSQGLLSDAGNAAVKQHLEGCRECRELAEGFSRMQAYIDNEKSIGAGPFFYTRLAQRMKNSSPGRQLPLRPALSWALTGLMLLFMLASLSGGFLTGRLAERQGIVLSGSRQTEVAIGTEYFLNDSSQFELENILLSDLN